MVPASALVILPSALFLISNVNLNSSAHRKCIVWIFQCPFVQNCQTSNWRGTPAAMCILKLKCSHTCIPSNLHKSVGSLILLWLPADNAGRPKKIMKCNTMSTYLVPIKWAPGRVCQHFEDLSKFQVPVLYTWGYTKLDLEGRNRSRMSQSGISSYF